MFLGRLFIFVRPSLGICFCVIYFIFHEEALCLLTYVQMYLSTYSLLYSFLPAKIQFHPLFASRSNFFFIVQILRHILKMGVLLRLVHKCLASVFNIECRDAAAYKESIVNCSFILLGRNNKCTAPDMPKYALLSVCFKKRAILLFS